MTAEEVRNNSTVKTVNDNGKMEVIKGAKVQVSHSSPPSLILEACLNASNEWQSQKSKDHDLPTNENRKTPPILQRFPMSPKPSKISKLCDEKNNNILYVEGKEQNLEPNQQCVNQQNNAMTNNSKGSARDKSAVDTEHHGTMKQNSHNSIVCTNSERDKKSTFSDDVDATSREHCTVISTASEPTVKFNHEHVGVLNICSDARNCIAVNSSQLMMKLMASDSSASKDKSSHINARDTGNEKPKESVINRSSDQNNKGNEPLSNIGMGSDNTPKNLSNFEVNNNIHETHSSSAHFSIQEVQASTTSSGTQNMCSSEASTTITATDSKPSKTPKITNPEILEQHISKIISENAAIVETLDPLWSRRYMRQSSSAHNAEADGKKTNGSVRVRRFSEDLNATVSRVNSLLPQKSKLQSALLGKIDFSRANAEVPPQIASTSVITSCASQPLLPSNASTSVSSAYSPYHVTPDKMGVQTEPMEETSIVKNLLLVKPTPKAKPVDIDKHPQNPEGSIIKDLLLKARSSSSLSTLKDDGSSSDQLRKHSREEISPLLYVCTVCKVAFRNKENLEVHQTHYCKGGRNSSVTRKISVIEPMPPPFAKKVPSSTRSCTPPWNSLPEKNCHQARNEPLQNTAIRTSSVVIETGNILKKHLTSPLNRLQGPPLKKRKISEPVISLNRPELSMFASTLDDFAEHANKRNFDAVAVSPRRPHSVQMFGGEVQILDGAKPKTINIDAGLCTQNVLDQPPNTANENISLLDNKTTSDVSTSSMSAVVVAIARPVLNSGGTVMEVSTAGMSHKSSVCLPVVALGQPIMATGAGVSEEMKSKITSLNSLPRSSGATGHTTNSDAKVYNSIPVHLSGADVVVSSSEKPTTVLSSFVAESMGTVLPPHMWPSLDLHSIASVDKFSKMSNSSSSGLPGRTSTSGKPFPEIIKQIPSLTYLDSKTPSPTSKGSLLFSALGFSNSRITAGSTAASSPATNTTVASSSSNSSAASTDDSASETKDDSQDSVSDKPQKFLAPVRPTSLPLKKKPFTLVGSTLVSPETPRPKKSCGQLYINGHAYTYLGLKCSTRSTYCCIYRPQPMYVPQDTKPKLSMYSNWQVVRAKEELGGLTPGKFIASYDSRQWLHGNGPVFSLACSTDLLSTHSSYWVFRQQEMDKKSAESKIADMQARLAESDNAGESRQESENPGDPKLLLLSQPALEDKQTIKHGGAVSSHEENRSDVKICEPSSVTFPFSSATSDASNGISEDKNGSDESAEETSDGTSDVSVSNAPKRVRIFEGGFKSNEDYTYVRGRGRGKYVCEECGIRCKKPSMLKKHIRTHTDLRPYSCRHCAFAFKTKGNLTKHMKSKAHHKKCVELGIIPVPKTIDDSQIDEEALAKQEQIERGRKQLSDGEDVDEDEEDEADDDMEDSDGYEEGDDVEMTSYDEGLSGGEDQFSSAVQSPNKQVEQFEDAPLTTPKEVVTEHTVEKEQEAARSLLDLSTLANSSTWSSVITTTSTSDIGKYINNTMDQPPLQESLLTSRPVASPGPSITKSPGNSSSGFIEVVDHVDDDASVSSNQVPQSQYLIGSPRVLWVTSESTGHRQRSYSFDMPPLRTSVVSENKALPQLHPQLPSSPEKSTILAAQLMSKDPAGRRYSMSAVGNTRQPTFIAPLPQWGRPVKEVPPMEDHLQQQAQRERSQSFSIAEYLHRERIPHAEEKQNSLRERSQSFSVAERKRWLEAREHDHAVGCSEQPIDLSVSRHRYEERPEDLVQASDTSAVVSWQREHEAAASGLPLSSEYLPPGHFASGESASPAVHAESCPPDVYNSGTKSSAMTNSLPEPRSISSRYMPHEESLLGSFLQYGSSAAIAYRNAINKSHPELSREELNAINDQRTCSPPVLEPVDEQISTDMSDYHALSPITPPTPERKSSGFFSGDESSMGATSQPLPPLDPSSCDNVEVSKTQSGFLLPTSMSNSSMEEGRCTCSICNKTFSKSSQLRLHLNIHYFERPFRCDSCSVSFRTKGHLQKHKRSVSHYNKVNMNITFGTPTTDNPRPFKCADCKIAFRIHGHLAKHLRSKMHIMKLECLGKLPFGMYAEMERSGVNLNEIDTTDCDNSLESLQVMAQRLYQRDPRRMRWHTPDNSQHRNEEESMKPGTYVSPSSHSTLPVNITESSTQTGLSPTKSVGSNSLGSSPQTMLLHLSQTVNPLTSPFLSPSYNSAEVKQEPAIVHDPYPPPHHLYPVNEIPPPPPENPPPSVTYVPPRTSPVPPVKEAPPAKLENENENSVITTTRSSTCHICGRLFKSAKFLQVHLYCDHPGLVPTSSTTNETASDRSKPEEPRPQQWVAEVRPSSNHQDTGLVNNAEVPQSFVCELCGRQFTNSSSLQQHLLSHAQPRPYVCEVCDAGFTSSALLAAHIHSHQQQN